MTLFGISLGSKRTGIAVLKDGVLVDWHVHNFQTEWSENKSCAIIKRYRQYILKHNVTDIVVKIPPLRQHTPPVSHLLKQIEALARKYECAFDLITKSELKHITGMRTGNELIEFTVLLYPQLSVIYDKGLSNDHRYYRKLFDAVLSAHIYGERQQARALQLKRAEE